MKKLIIAALVSAQLAAGAPAVAADFARTDTQQVGAFGGLSLRVPLDGRRDRRQVRAGIAFAPMLQSRAQDGSTVRTRIGDGLEFGIAGNQAPALRIGGTPVDRIGAPDGRRANISTIGWIAIGVGASVVILVSAFALCMDDSECNPSE